MKHMNNMHTYQWRHRTPYLPSFKAIVWQISINVRLPNNLQKYTQNRSINKIDELTNGDCICVLYKCVLDK
jgi:hypothetical protein